MSIPFTADDRAELVSSATFPATTLNTSTTIYASSTLSNAMHTNTTPSASVTTSDDDGKFLLPAGSEPFNVLVGMIGGICLLGVIGFVGLYLYETRRERQREAAAEPSATEGIELYTVQTPQRATQERIELTTAHSANVERM